MRFLAIGLLLVAGCDDLPQARSESEIRQLAREEYAREEVRHEARISALEQRADALAKRIEITTDLSLATSDSLDSLRTTFNKNVEQDNQAAADRMTARAACGTRLVTMPTGGQYYENVKCTVKDLR